MRGSKGFKVDKVFKVTKGFKVDKVFKVIKVFRDLGGWCGYYNKKAVAISRQLFYCYYDSLFTGISR